MARAPPQGVWPAAQLRHSPTSTRYTFSGTTAATSRPVEAWPQVIELLAAGRDKRAQRAPEDNQARRGTLREMAPKAERIRSTRDR